MAGQTVHYHLDELEAGDSLSTNGYKFTKADRQTIDRLLYLGAEGHRHTGAAPATNDPVTPPTLAINTLGNGSLPASTRVYYKYTLVDTYGNESAASPEARIDTPAAVATPGAPILTINATIGTLTPGNYFYVLSAYANGVNTQETPATVPAYVTVTTGSTNSIIVGFPSLPAGATGFNIYRRRPGGTDYFYLTSVNMAVATPPTSFTDNGSLVEDCNRVMPAANTTNAGNSVVVTYPGTTPSIPAGYTWRIYRTMILGDYSKSLLKWVVEQTFEGSGIITTTYEDTGGAVSSGRPPTFSQVVGGPSKVLVTNAAEVQGSLPMGTVAGFPYVLTFSFSGFLSIKQGASLWVCEFPKAQIIGCRAVLGNGSTPAAQSVIVDVLRGTSMATPTETTIYTTTGNRPRVQVGQTVGSRTVPDIVDLRVGDALRCDVLQVGGGTTPTDHDLTVNVYMWVFGFPTTTWVPSF